MERIKPFKKWRVETEITERLAKRKQEERHRGSMTSYIEGILDKYADDLLVESHRNIENR